MGLCRTFRCSAPFVVMGVAARAIRSVFAALAGVVAVCLALTACGPGPGEAATSGASTSAAPVSSPVTPDPRRTPASSTGAARNLPRPELPEIAKQNTKEGFAAFTQYWLDTVTYAFEAGDVRPLTDASDAACRVCARFVQDARELHDRGQWSVGPRWTVQNPASDMIKDSRARVLGRYLAVESPSTEYGADSRIIRSFPGEPTGTWQEIYAVFGSEGWKTTETGNV